MFWTTSASEAARSFFFGALLSSDLTLSDEDDEESEWLGPMRLSRVSNFLTMTLSFSNVMELLP